jgi:hypothetical protein
MNVASVLKEVKGILYQVISFSQLQDLTHLFDWNTKQLFVMLIAHYKTAKNVSHLIL